MPPRGRGEDAGARDEGDGDAVRAGVEGASGDARGDIALSWRPPGVHATASAVHVRWVRVEQEIGEQRRAGDDDFGGVRGGMVDGVRGKRVRDAVRNGQSADADEREHASIRIVAVVREK